MSQGCNWPQALQIRQAATLFLFIFPLPTEPTVTRPAITPEKRAEMRGHVREALIELARRRGVTTGDTEGWRKITIRDVINEAGISTGTFYRYFKDRTDLAQTLWVEPVNALRATMQADCDAASNPEEKVRSLLSNYAKFAIENRALFRAVFLFVRPEENEKPDQANLEEEPFFSNLCRAFDQGQASGDFREFDKREMAQVFWAGIHGSLALPENLDRFRFDSPEQLAAAMIDSLLLLILKR